MEIVLKFSPEAVQVILNALSKRPYEEVHELVSGILDEANAQIKAQSEVKPAEGV